jgi:polyprenyldihydroxybenzoate methyltransferase/3-demethylubiquinol 3-O-methyltransferase
MSPFKCLSTTNNAGNAPATLPKAPEPQIVDALVAQTHTSAVLVPPQQVDGTKVVVKVPEEYPFELLAPSAEPPKKNDNVVVKFPEEYPCELLAPAESPKRNDLELPKREDSGDTTRTDVPKAGETEPLSSALPNLDIKERQAHSNSHEARKDSVDKKETAKFAAIAATWWDPKGPYKPLHIMNPTRVSYIRSSICKHFSKDANTARPLEGLKIVDVGCGGGLVCEPLARMGAEMTGVDAVEKNIGVASVHAGRDPSTASIKYMWTTAEQLVREEQKFDVVLALEVIEHVADPEDFCRSLAALTKKDGLVFISTLNRSLPSFGLAIVAAEYILGWLPKGTHEWSKFITPGELSSIMDRSSIEVKDTTGMVYNPITQRWSISGSNTSVNYIAYGVNRSIKI